MMRKSFFLSITILIFVLWIFPDQKSQDTTEKEQQKLEYKITVTANRIEKSTKKVAASTTVITGEELEKFKLNTLYEALREIAGLDTIQNGASGQTASLFIRGANSSHTKIMLDGTELNDPMDPNRSFDFSHLFTENIDRIEIIRGPQSTLYGSDAMAGVIHIITRQEQGKPHFHLSSMGGTYDTLQGKGEISGSTEKLSYSLGASYFKTSGFSAASSRYEGNTEKDGYQNTTFSGKLGFQLKENMDLHFSMRKIDAKTDIDNNGGDYGDDPNNTGDYDLIFLKGGFRGLFMKNRWETKIDVSYADSLRKYINPTDTHHPYSSYKSEYKSHIFKIDFQNNLFLHESNTLIFGLEFDKEYGSSFYESQSFYGPYESEFPEKNASNVGIYAQDQMNLDDSFIASVGARYDNHSTTGNSLTYQIAPLYILNSTGTKLKATFGTGFKAPSLYQLYAPATFYGPIGNTELQPEKTLGLDAGIEQELLGGRLLVKATYFTNSYKDLIDYDYTKGYINIGKASSKGAEFTLNSIPVKDMTFSASYTWCEAVDERTEQALLRRPEHKASMRMGYDGLKKTHITVSLLYVGEREDSYFQDYQTTRVTLPEYTLCNASVSYDLFKYAQFFLRWDNIFNTDYEYIKGYAAPGFSVYGGVKLDF
ncbi:MAG TPA: TonB-dependent receptor [Candidatus Aminicenantes bacterium]|nr:TonB-dependent receptor [Candidatus Aminicenantes bacterium]